MLLPTTIDSPYFKLFTINGIYTLPSPYLDLEDITSVSATATVSTYEALIISPHSCKLFLKGHVLFTFQYADTTSTSQLHSLNFTQSFSLYLPIPYELKDHIFNLSTLVEDNYSIDLSPRTLYYTVTLIAIASPIPSKGVDSYERYHY